MASDPGTRKAVHRPPDRPRRRIRFGRLHWRLLAVNLVVLLVPIVGIEFARIYERELLATLEADMRHQAVLTRRFVENLSSLGVLEDATLESILARAARTTRLRIRVLDAQGEVRVDSHREGPPEGPEPPPPRHFASRASVDASGGRGGARWSPLPERIEVRTALAGKSSAYTRIRQREPSVLLFLSEPLWRDGEVIGVVYVTGSTAPVMAKLYRVRERLKTVMLVALGVTLAVTLLLAWSITRPLERLARSATRIAAGEYNLSLPIGGSGEVRELAQALSTMTETLRQRLRDTATFAADVAHGFKSPLTAIRGSAELLGTGAVEDPAARARFLEGIELEVERLDRLVSQLLELSRLEASEVVPAPVQLREVLEELAERYENPDARIVLELEAALPPVAARQDDLSLALANLLDNALKVTPPSGEVRVFAQSHRSQSNQSIRIAVEDDGPGIPQGQRSRIFERFFTTDKEQGTGLGLPITRAVIEAIGGRVFLDPAPRPTRFIVELPAADPRHVRADRPL